MSQRRPRRSMTLPARGTSRSVTSRSTFPSGRWMFARDAGVLTIASLTDPHASLTDGFSGAAEGRLPGHDERRLGLLAVGIRAGGLILGGAHRRRRAAPSARAS